MVKLNNNEINDALDAELGKNDIKAQIARMKEQSEKRKNFSGEEFSVDKYSEFYNFRVIKEAEDLKEGTSYSEHMLDLNELMEKGILHRGNAIDLSEMPEIETIQAATQEQLDMLTPESKKQITAIHLSNNTPVGWNDDYDFDNKHEMDSKLNLSSYHNVTEVQTHFYVNNDLEDIIMPEKATELLCRHSKMDNLQKDGGLQDIEVVLDRAKTSFDFDDGYVDPDEERDILVAEEKAKYHSEQEKDGKYTLYYEDTPVLKDLNEPAEVELTDVCGWQDIKEYEGISDKYASISVNGESFLKIEKQNENPLFYKVEEEEYLTNPTMCSKMKLTNSLNSEDTFKSLRMLSNGSNRYGGEFD